MRQAYDYWQDQPGSYFHSVRKQATRTGACSPSSQTPLQASKPTHDLRRDRLFTVRSPNPPSEARPFGTVSLVQKLDAANQPFSDHTQPVSPVTTFQPALQDQCTISHQSLPCRPFVALCRGENSLYRPTIHSLHQLLFSHMYSTGQILYVKPLKTVPGMRCTSIVVHSPCSSCLAEIVWCVVWHSL